MANSPAGQGWPDGLCVTPWGASLDRGSACLGRYWLARACSHNLGRVRGAGQAAARIARAGMGGLGGLRVAARRGPALDLACMCMPRRVPVGLCAGQRLLQGAGKRAQAPTRDHSQACFSRVIMLVCISMQNLLGALAVFLVFLSLPNMWNVFCSRFPACLRAAAVLAMLSLSFRRALSFNPHPGARGEPV